MLQQLIIRNYAIIDYLELVPDAYLNTITGETGAGKSIIVGALSLILGERADNAVVINKNEKCVIEGHFDVKQNETFRQALIEEGLDEDLQCIIRREISGNGKSRAFINDTPVTLNLLNRLTSLLVDMQQQFGQFVLDDDNFQTDVIDAVAELFPLRKNYKRLYDEYKGTDQQLNQYKLQQSQARKEADYKQYLYDELVQADFKENELENAAIQLKQMNNAERIIGVLEAGRFILEEGDIPLVNELKRLNQQLQNISNLVPEIVPLQIRILAAHADLKDISVEFEELERKVSIDQEVLLQIQERIDLGYKLLKKHEVVITNDLLALRNSLQQELKATADLTNTIDALTKLQEDLYKKVVREAEKLSAGRKKAASAIAGRINELMISVGMPNARFQVSFAKQPPNQFGIDDIQFLLDANKSGSFQPVAKAASGGELSRVMLCIKSMTAKALNLSTLIFDEIDTGISGEAAKQVSVLLRDLAKYHQVICITHQPQVAARGSRHFYVYKEEGDNKRITTKIRMLQKDERVLAIAQMIGGEKPSEAALQNARELVAL